VTLLSNPGSHIFTGRKQVAAAGTAEALVSLPESISSVAVQGFTTNTGEVCIGDANIVAADGSERGMFLGAGESTTIAIDDLSKLYVDAKVSGEGVTFTYVTV